MNLLHKRADNIGMLNFQLTDFSTKIKIQSSARSVLGLKLGIYDETSNATYVGITQSMYESGNYDFLRIAPDDLLHIRRYTASFTHDFFINDKAKIRTTAFAYTTTRNWRRQDFVYNNLDSLGNINNYPNNFSGVIWGDTTIQGGAILMRNQTGNRNRQFEVAGIQSNFNYDYVVAGTKNHFVVGARFMYERAFEQRINGTKTDVSYGVLRDAEVRTGFGTSAYAHNQTQIGEKINLTGGIRAELIDYERSIERINNIDTIINNSTSTLAIIPGIGINYLINKKNAMFAGIHRGFAPPRLKDAISNSGEDLELDAELSWNFEFGARGSLLKGVVYEAALFHLDFENQIIPIAESAGGVGAGLVNAGATTHSGFEITTIFELHEIFKMMKHKLQFSGNYTFVRSVFSDDRFIAGGTNNIKGNTTPYAPSHLANAAITYEHKSGIGARIQSTYVGKQFTDIANTVGPSANGRTGVMDAFYVLDATASYHLKKYNTTFVFSAKNLTNERSIATRRPQGIRVMNPRTLTFSLLWSL
jgi:Fe(3+) dicitrate transport protein